MKNEISVNVTSIKDRVKEAGEKSSSVLTKITDEILVSSVTNNKAVECLKEFILKQKELSQPYTIKQKSALYLSKVPVIGKTFENTYLELKSTQLDTQSVQEMVSDMYDTMLENNNIVVERVKKLFEIEGELKIMFKELSSLNKELDEEASKVNFDSHEGFEFQKLSLNIKKRIADVNDEIKNIQQVGTVTRALAIQIEETLPSDKNKLLRRISTFSTINEAQAQLSNYMELKNIVDDLADSTDQAIFGVLNGILDAQEADAKDIKKIEDREVRRKKHYKEIENKISQSKQNLSISLDRATKQTEQIMIENKNAD
jgi:hypothetical protein